MLPPTPRKLLPWNKGRLARSKLPLRPKHVWSAWMTLQIEGRARDLTMFNLAIGSKLRESNLAHERPLRANSGRYEAACSCRNWCSSPDLRQTALAPTPEDGQGFGLGFAVRNKPDAIRCRDRRENSIGWASMARPSGSTRRKSS